MAVSYVMSDIHGYLNEFLEAMKQIDLTGDQKLILLGDYIDGGADSFKVLQTIYELQQKFGEEKIVVLRGNHEEAFLEYLDGECEEWIESDYNLSTVRSFLSENQFEQIKDCFKNGKIERGKKLIQTFILEEHEALIQWIRGLLYYYETEQNIFVHAGIDEESGEWWKYGMLERDYLYKYPPVVGNFYKNIVAGHVGTDIVSGKADYQGVYYDGKSHYYIDGNVTRNHVIPILKVDEATGTYYTNRVTRDGEWRLI